MLELVPLLVDVPLLLELLALVLRTLLKLVPLLKLMLSLTEFPALVLLFDEIEILLLVDLDMVTEVPSYSMTV
jgi:hypothetical protein